MPLDDMRQQIELKLRGELLRDWCRQLAQVDNSVEFEDSWCSGQRSIRLCTKLVDVLVGSWRGSGDCWGLGRLAFYEIGNGADGLGLSLVVSGKALPREVSTRLAGLFPDVDLANGGEAIALRSWPLVEGPCSSNDAVALLESTWNERVVPFERELSARLLQGEETEVVPEAPDESVLVEGAELEALSTRFERNKKARELCIAAHGSVCAVCGFDFAKAYGEQFSGIIDVHHRVPLNEIRSDYVVDPVRDLVPLCPNCHRAIHSKPGGGAYSVEELVALRGKARKRTA